MSKFSKATLGDLSQIYAIYMHKTVSPFMSFPVMSEEEFLPIFKEFYLDLTLWRENGEILALMIAQTLKYRRSHVAFISKLAINPGSQSQGVGTKFITDTLSRLKAEGIKRVELIVESDNPRAIRFYQKLGFRIEGTMKQYLNREGDYIDDHFMAILL